MVGARTSSTLPLPFSLIVNANEISKPVTDSARRRKAWCEGLAVLPSFTVRSNFNVSDEPKLMGLDNVLWATSLSREYVSY